MDASMANCMADNAATWRNQPLLIVENLSRIPNVQQLVQPCHDCPVDFVSAKIAGQTKTFQGAARFIYYYYDHYAFLWLHSHGLAPLPHAGATLRGSSAHGCLGSSKTSTAWVESINSTNTGRSFFWKAWEVTEDGRMWGLKENTISLKIKWKKKPKIQRELDLWFKNLKWKNVGKHQPFSPTCFPKPQET